MYSGVWHDGNYWVIRLDGEALKVLVECILGPDFNDDTTGETIDRWDDNYAKIIDPILKLAEDYL